MRFVDTNVLLYAISRDEAEHGKAAQASELLSSREVALSVQVLQEFYVQATRDSRPDRLDREQAAALMESFRRFPVQETTMPVMLSATAFPTETRQSSRRPVRSVARQFSPRIWATARITGGCASRTHSEAKDPLRIPD